jgi:hypothetical protein
MTEQKKYTTFRDLRQAPAPASTSTPSIASTTSTPRSSSASIAPERDFQRVPNSVTKQAMAQGLFRGKSKQVYDYLWSVSRGAIVPSRSVRKSRKEIKVGSGLGSMVTVDAAIEHLLKVGLISVDSAVGSLIGNSYEVFTYEEASTRSSSISSTTSLTQNLVHLDQPESSSTRRTQTIDSKAGSGSPNTSFNTNTEKNFDDDDAALAGLNETLRSAAMELTGKKLSPTENERWRELAELLVAELKIAAARTTVSSVPAFLTEHLRRRLWKLDKRQAGGEGKQAIAEEKSAFTTGQIKNCPDCGGSGMYYPEGYDKGVAKCKHENLNREGNDPSTES